MDIFELITDFKEKRQQTLEQFRINVLSFSDLSEREARKKTKELIKDIEEFYVEYWADKGYEVKFGETENETACRPFVIKKKEKDYMEIVCDYIKEVAALRESSWVEEKQMYELDTEDCCMISRHLLGKYEKLWYLIALSFHWWNDLLAYAEDRGIETNNGDENAWRLIAKRIYGCKAGEVTDEMVRLAKDKYDKCPSCNSDRQQEISPVPEG